MIVKVAGTREHLQIHTEQNMTALNKGKISLLWLSAVQTIVSYLFLSGFTVEFFNYVDILW